MKIFVIASKHLYDKVSEIKDQLEANGHEITPPNGFDNPDAESNQKEEDYIEWKQNMLRKDKEIVSKNDAIFVLNYEKKGQENYIGGAVFLEMYLAWSLNKKIYLMNPIPENMLKDEIKGLNPIVINGDLKKIKN